MMRRSKYRSTFAQCMYVSAVCALHTLYHNRLLCIQLLCVPRVTLLLAVLQARACVTLQHAVLAAEVTFTETAVADDGLCSLLAFFETAPRLLWWGHAATQRREDVEGAVVMDLEILEGRRWLSGGQVATGVEQPEGLWGDVGV